MKPGLIVVTAGPSYEPIDEVRRLTNHSTGELGIVLFNTFTGQGWPVLLLLGSGATVRGPLPPGARVEEFTTNDDLQRKLARIPSPVAAVFHAAALGDFRVKAIVGAEVQPKLASRGGDLTLTLEPAPKLLALLPGMFPHSRLVGWKYELNGGREDALANGRRQLQKNATDLCVLNGRAWGEGFGILHPDGTLVPQANKPALAQWLADWLGAASVLAKH